MVERSGEFLKKGNNFIHSLDLKDYEKEIIEFNEKFDDDDETL